MLCLEQMEIFVTFIDYNIYRLETGIFLFYNSKENLRVKQS